MKFKDWLLDEIRYGGFYRQFRQENPNIPTQAAKDLYNNRVGYTMKTLLGSNRPEHAPTQPFQGSDSDPKTFGNGIQRGFGNWLPSNTPSKIINAHDLGDIRWSQKPQKIDVTPLSFDDWTLQTMINRRFGFKEDARIRDDANRMEIQKNLLPNIPDAKNEPIIVVQNGNKYRLMEGWHRTMSYLVFDHNEQVGAPSDQIEILKNGDIRQLDFAKWRPVPINAYIGYKNTNSSNY